MGAELRVADTMEIFTAAGFAALLQVIAIDLVLAGDNAIVIGLAAAGLPADQRKKAILIGVIAATVLRIGFAASPCSCSPSSACCWPAASCCFGSAGRCGASCASRPRRRHDAAEALANADLDDGRHDRRKGPRKTLSQAAPQIVIADVSMSLDNVLAVAGAARDHPSVLISA